MRAAIVLALAFAASGCSAFRAAEKDPATALGEVVIVSKKVGNDVAAACAKYRAAEAKNEIPAGKVKDDLDAFCALDATWRAQHP